MNTLSQDKKAEIEHFSGLASKNFGTSDWSELKFDRVLHYFSSIDKKEILDLGCGGGNFTTRLKALGFNVVGLDISLDLIKVNRQSNKDTKFICGDAEFLPFYDASFDIILVAFLLHHFKKHEHIVSEIFRVLKKGGKVLCVEPNCWNPVSWYSIIQKLEEKNIMIV